MSENTNPRPTFLSAADATQQLSLDARKPGFDFVALVVGREHSRTFCFVWHDEPNLFDKLDSLIRQDQKVLATIGVVREGRTERKIDVRLFVEFENESPYFASVASVYSAECERRYGAKSDNNLNLN